MDYADRLTNCLLLTNNTKVCAVFLLGQLKLIAEDVRELEIVLFTRQGP